MPGPQSGKVLIAVNGVDRQPWIDGLSKGREVVVSTERLADPSITYALVWKQPQGILNDLPNLKALFSLGAGVDHLLADPTLPDAPLVRVVSPNLTQYMVEYVVWRLLDHLRQGRRYREAQNAGEWLAVDQPLASDITVGFMGIGELGGAAAGAAKALGFRVVGWSRTEKAFTGPSFHGSSGLKPFLAATDVLIVLLPLTAETRGIIDMKLLGGLRQSGPLGGPVLINAGRGKLQNEADILGALEDGTLSEASLDVFETEPLPASSPLWSHPKVFITPHSAAPSEASELAPAMLAQMAAFDRGEPLRHLVDRHAGY